MNKVDALKPETGIFQRSKNPESLVRLSVNTVQEMNDTRLSLYQQVSNGRAGPKKKNLAIALDGTLMNFQPEKSQMHVNSSLKSQKPSKFREKSSERPNNYVIANRPGIEAFLIAMASCYNLYAVSCWSKKKTKLIMQRACIDSFFMDSFKKKTKVFIPGRSLRHGRALADSSKTIFIDSCKEQISKNHSNGVLLPQFVSDEADDDSLMRLIPFLIFVSQFEDVRPIKKFYDMFSQQKKKIVGIFGPFLVPSDDEADVCEDVIDDDDEQCLSKGAATLSSQTNGNIKDLKNRILKSHLMVTAPKESVDYVHKGATLRVENSGKFTDSQGSTKSQIEKESLGDFNELTQTADLFSRINFQKFSTQSKNT